jgi:hypothetical protein
MDLEWLSRRAKGAAVLGTPVRIVLAGSGVVDEQEVISHGATHNAAALAVY